MKKPALSLTLIFALLVACGQLLAHHGEANYDTEKVTSAKGVVTDFQFINPHVQISIDVKNDKGDTEKWIGEARSPAMLARYGGWDKDTIKIGDTITMVGHRTKNGTNFLRLIKIETAGGKVLDNL
jgi:Family of unknown function (DUF6152)